MSNKVCYLSTRYILHILKINQTFFPAFTPVCSLFNNYLIYRFNANNSLNIYHSPRKINNYRYSDDV